MCEQIEKLLAELSLTKALEQTALSLSGGQQRRLSICMSLLGDPRFCVLDEPTTGVDAVSRCEIWSALKARRKDRVILFTTHFMDEADLLAGAHLRPHVPVFYIYSYEYFRRGLSSSFNLCFLRSESDNVAGQSAVRRHVAFPKDSLVSDTHFGIRLQLPVNHSSHNES